MYRQFSSILFRRNFSTIKNSFVSKDKVPVDYLPTIIESTQIKRPSDWKEIRKKLLEAGGKLNDKTVDTMTLNYCINNKTFDYGLNYLKYLNKEKIKLNLGTIGASLKLYAALFYENQLGEKEEKEILKMYKSLKKDYDVLDTITLESAIAGLSVTNEWKTCFNLLDECKRVAIPASQAYNAIISAAFRNNNEELGWKLFDEMMEHKRIPLNFTYATILKQVNSKEGMNKFEKLLNAIGYHNLDIEKEVANQLIETGNKIGLSSVYTDVSKTGLCGSCRVVLDKNDVTAEEFDLLKADFFRNVVIGKNVFLKSTPEELEKFTNFANQIDKYDVVIDGLNVAYSQGIKVQPQVFAKLLFDVVNHFVQRGQKVLLLGRIHLERLTPKYWNSIKRNATVFLTENISQDDPYILYCAMHCGPKTTIITRDLMRSHLYLLKDNRSKVIFKRWLARNRLHLITVKQGEVIFRKPLPYLVMPQKNSNTWHVPYVYNITDNPRTIHYKWICMKQKAKQ